MVKFLEMSVEGPSHLGRVWPAILKNDFESVGAGSVNIVGKDIHLGVELGELGSTPVVLGRELAEAFEAAQANGWGEEQVHYLPNFVTAKTVPKIKRKEHYTSNNATLLLALGRLHENKAFDVLLEAFAQVPNAYLWIAGEGPLRKNLEREAERLGVRPRIRFLGWRQDVEALYATADILVCPSRHEPLGNVIIEGWAHGIPVVAADILGPGALIKNEETGILFPVNDANALAAALKMLISNDELGRRLAENGKKIYKTTFSEKIVVDKYIKLFERMSP